MSRHVPNTYQTRPKHLPYMSQTRLVRVPDKLPYMSQTSCKVARRLVYILDEFQCGMTSMFFVKGKTRCGREEYAHLKSYRTSRFHIHLSHTHACTHTKKANALHVTSQSDKWARQPPNARKWIEADDIQTHTHARVENSTPKRPLNLTRLMTRKKKKNSKREETVFQHACMGKYCSGT